MTRGDSAVLELRVDSLRRERVEILCGIDWTIRRGEHWALIGPNGSGKTTLLNLLAGYLWPTRGSLVVLGHAFGAVDLRDLRRSIGIASDALAHRFPPELAALDVVASGFEASIGLSWRPFTDEQRAAARRALDTVGAGAIALRRYGVLSEGEQQRVMIARALVHEPALLVLDEPCAGLDPLARERFLADLTRLAATRRAPAMVFVTHHVEEIPSFVGHALVLKAGRALAAGRITDVLTAAVLSDAFDAPCVVERRDGRFALQLVPRQYPPAHTR